MSEAAAEEPAALADPRLAAAIFAALVAACFVALIVTQRLKHTPTPVQEFKRTRVVMPASAGPDREEHLSFKPTKADRVTVRVESSSGATVATLVTDLAVARYRIVSLRWDGRRGIARGYSVITRANGYTTLVPHNHGAIAPSGEYHLRVDLLEEKRSVPSPETFKLVAP
ncbi:MAG: hypothetical protein ACRDK4_15870 [Solirubrobacteraceae bacterium]